MRYQIKFFDEAHEDLKRIKAYLRAEVLNAIETHLRFEPTKTSQSRIKQLRDMKTPQFRLHIGEVRVFYDVNGDTVEIIAIVFKSDAADWLEREGEKL